MRTRGRRTDPLRQLTRGVSFAALVLTFAAAPAGAQLVRGTIVDSASRRPLSGATISVVGEPSSVRSNDDGRFVLPLHRAGTVVMTVRRLGYAPQTWTFAMTAADTADATLPIVPSAAQLDTVDVNATPAAAVPAHVPTSSGVANRRTAVSSSPARRSTPSIRWRRRICCDAW